MNNNNKKKKTWEFFGGVDCLLLVVTWCYLIDAKLSCSTKGAVWCPWLSHRFCPTVSSNSNCCCTVHFNFFVQYLQRMDVTQFIFQPCTFNRAYIPLCQEVLLLCCCAFWSAVLRFMQQLNQVASWLRNKIMSGSILLPFACSYCCAPYGYCTIVIYYNSIFLLFVDLSQSVKFFFILLIFLFYLFYLLLFILIYINLFIKIFFLLYFQVKLRTCRLMPLTIRMYSHTPPLSVCIHNTVVALVLLSYL